jgi:nicotinate-nucleotide adenylyltransferase
MAHTIVYGGTFDPIHHGHLITAQSARELLGADRVVFVPARISPHKLDRVSASGDHRLAMIERAIAGNPYFFADGRELVREGPSYTFDTLAALRREQPEERWTLLMGADQLPKLHTWHRIGEFFEGAERIEVAVLRRQSPISGDVWRALAGQLGASVAERLAAAQLATPFIEISATEIRRRVGAGLPIDYLVPLSIAEYIREHGLYGS